MRAAAAVAAAAALAVTGASALCVDQTAPLPAVKSTHLPEVMDFAAFERTFAKKYENAVERIERMAVFEKNLAIIAAHNGEASAPWPAPSPTRAPARAARPHLPGRRKDVTLSIAASAPRDRARRGVGDI